MSKGVEGGSWIDRALEAGHIVEPELDPPFDVLEPDVLGSCLVLSSPHSGSAYPARFLASARLDPISLRRSEDAFVDQLFMGARAFGAPLLRARFPRAYLDVNREPYELDPRMFDGRLPPFVNSRSMRVAGGLGTIARVVGEAQEIYLKRLSVDEAIRRIEYLYKPYHATLQGLVDRAMMQFGQTLLIDCHSMPSCALGSAHGPMNRDDRLKADFVIGDRYGTSCGRAITETADAVLSGLGYAVERNKPYAGGFITENYGHPAGGRHALQIEVNRALYMNERLMQHGPAFETVASHLSDVMAALAALMDGMSATERAAAE
ncbi:N-formylglutamate amidohydrolase [Lichenihabitans psoromatis]|uniref:N-formylglutamate amidohydrolase n=1 Tax=Lichenihabitans psoromatis TaxID=2528642 RepID=UPI001036BEFE|nr:N-formylglutamate amidohydrolase [Lichenihabitans psoromatis]